MPETLNTVGEKIAALADSIDVRLSQADGRLDQLATELRARLEAVDALVRLVADKVDNLVKRDVRQSAVHARLMQRLDNHKHR